MQATELASRAYYYYLLTYCKLTGIGGHPSQTLPLSLCLSYARRWDKRWEEIVAKLTVARVRAERRKGMHGDGEGLYLCVGATGSKSWIFRTTVHGRRIELGLGSASLVSLAEARDEARRLRKEARAGGDPKILRRRETLTFTEAARRVHQNLLPTWRNTKHAEIWIARIENYATPHFGTRPIATITTQDVLRALEPIWTQKNETARRFMQRLAIIFDWRRAPAIM